MLCFSILFEVSHLRLCVDGCKNRSAVPSSKEASLKLKSLAGASLLARGIHLVPIGCVRF